MRGESYSSPTLAGSYIFVSNDRGNTIVLKPGREYRPMAVNMLSAFRSCPVFDGDRMYIRALKMLYCIGRE